MIQDTKQPRYKVVIIDDDFPSIRLLADALEHRDDILLCGTATTLAEGEQLVRKHAPDLLFLDMEFPDSNGLEWFEQASLPTNTRVVFHTCYRRYIHDALSLKVFDFLLKPFDRSDLEVIMRRLNSETDPVMRRGGTPFIPVVASDSIYASPGAPMRPIAITSVINSKIIVNPAEIVYFRYLSERKIWECVFSNLKRIILKRQTTAETILGYGSDFVRTHKHFIVNMRYVGIISGNDCMLLPPLDSITEIKISKSYRRDLLDRFYDI